MLPPHLKRLLYIRKCLDQQFPVLLQLLQVLPLEKLYVRPVHLCCKVVLHTVYVAVGRTRIFAALDIPHVVQEHRLRHRDV